MIADPILSAATKIFPSSGQRWEYGPICFAGERKAYVTDLDTYLHWVSRVEINLGDAAATAQRIRMLYYSEVVDPKGPGKKFDDVINTTGRWKGAPLTTADVPQDVLDGLMGTGSLSVGANQDRQRFVDVSHVWVLLDAALNGLGILGLGLDVVDSAIGLLSWTGDLGSWWTEYQTRKFCHIQTLPKGQALNEDPKDLTVPSGWLAAGQATRCALDDLYGDMDAMALAIVGAPLVRNGKSLTDLLAEYYLPNQNTNPTDRSGLHCANRFHLFVRNCSPAIPFDDVGSSAVTLKGIAQSKMREIVKAATHILLANSRGMTPRLMWNLFIPTAADLSLMAMVGVETSVERDISSPWGAAMINSVADQFTAFLTAGLAGTAWTSSKWPTDDFAIDSERRGGMVLQFGDSDKTGTYGGQAKTPGPYVENLQNDLSTLGFTGGGTADGLFRAPTAMALREFQIEASQPQIWVKYHAQPSPNASLPAIRRYRGPINGVADLETLQAIEHWLHPDPPPRHCRAKAGPGEGLEQISNPVSIQSRGGTKSSNPTGVIVRDMWWYTESGVGTGGAPPYPFVYAIDQLQRYAIPPTEAIGADPGCVCIGKWTNEGSGGPAIQQGSTWASTLVTLHNLVPPPLDPNSTTIRSRYRVIRAVSQVEDVGHFDSYNCWDGGVLSFGVMHWAFLPSGLGELGAFLAFYKFRDAQAYARDFGAHGIQPEKAWDQISLDPIFRNYNARLAMYGLHDANGAIQPRQLLPLQRGGRSKDSYMSDWLRSWRNLHRVAIALRTSVPLQQAQWFFASQRLVDLLNFPWPGGSTTNKPVVSDAGTQRPANIGEVFTSEQAVAVLLRWHVNRPLKLLPSAIQQAYTGAFGSGTVDVSAIREPARSQKQEALVDKLVDLAPEDWFRNSVTTARDYSETEAGALSATADSYVGT